MATPLDYGTAGQPRNAPSLAAWAKATGDAVGAVDTAWTNLALLNSWVPYDTTPTYGGARYRKLAGGLVELQLMVKNGSAATAQIGVMPAGYRPGLQLILPGVSNDALVRVDIQQNGGIYPKAGAATAWLALNAVYYADA